MAMARVSTDGRFTIVERKPAAESPNWAAVERAESMLNGSTSAVAEVQGIQAVTAIRAAQRALSEAHQRCTCSASRARLRQAFGRLERAAMHTMAVVGLQEGS